MLVRLQVLIVLTALAPAGWTQTTIQGDAQLVWEARLDVPVPTEDELVDAVLHEGVLYAVGESRDGKSSLLASATDAATGAELWSFVYDDGQAHAHTGRSIALSGGVLVVGGEREFGFFPGHAGLLIGLDPSDGSQLWVRELGAPSDPKNTTEVSFAKLVPSSTPGELIAAVHQEFISQFDPYDPANPDQLHRIDAATGESLSFEWVFNMTEIRELALSPDGSRLALAGRHKHVDQFGSFSWDYAVSCRSAVDGSAFWNTDLVTNIPQSAGEWAGGQCVAWSPSGERVLVGGGAATAQVNGLDAGDGSLLWSLGEPNFAAQQLEVDAQGRAVVAGERDGLLRVHAFDESTGLPIWSTSGESIDAVEDLLVDATSQRALVCVRQGSPVQSDHWSLLAWNSATGGLVWNSSVGPGDGKQDWARSLLPAEQAGQFWAVGSRYDSDNNVRGLLRQHALEDGALLLEVHVDQGLRAGDQLVERSLLAADASTLWCLGRAGWMKSNGGVDTFQYWLSASSTLDGSTLWVRTLDQPETAFGFADTLVEDPHAGRLFLGGALDAENGLVRAFDSATGVELWQSALDLLPGSEAILSLRPVPGANLVLAVGRVADGVHLHALDSLTGALLWTQSQPAASSGSELALRVRSDGGSAYLAYGVDLANPTVSDLLLLALDPLSGAVQWSQQLDSDGLSSSTDVDSLEDLLLSPDDAALYVYTRTFLPDGNNPGSATYRLDAATGAVQWTSTFSTPGVNDTLRPDRLALSPDGNTLYSLDVYWLIWGLQQTYLRLTALDATTGASLWTALHLTGALEAENAAGLEPSADGESVLVVGGAGLDDPNQDGLTAAYDADTGEFLWSASLAGAADAPEPTRGLAILPDGRRALVASQSALDPSQRDLVLSAYALPTLTAVPSELSLAAGGTQSFDLSGGLAQAGQTGFLLGSLSGTSPGIDLGSGQLLPLNYDAYTAFTASTPNTALLSGSLGPLDADGHREATLSLPAGTTPALAGLQLHHAWVAFDLNGLSLVSHAVGLDLLP